MRLGFPSEGFGANPKLEIALTSYHIKHDPNSKTNFNQFDSSKGNYLTNPGFGISVDSGFRAMDTPIRFEADIYKNSYFKSSLLRTTHCGKY